MKEGTNYNFTIAKTFLGLEFRGKIFKPQEKGNHYNTKIQEKLKKKTSRIIVNGNCNEININIYVKSLS